jgi:hypothetical protein
MSALIKRVTVGQDCELKSCLPYILCLSMDHTKYLPVSHEVLQKRFEPAKILQGVISMKRFEVTCTVHINDRCELIVLQKKIIM